MSEQPRGNAAPQRNPGLFALASKAAEIHTERFLTGDSSRAMPSFTCRLNIAAVVEDLAQRMGWERLKFEGADPLSLSLAGVYGSLHVALCKAWAAAYPLASGEPPPEYEPPRRNGGMKSFADLSMPRG